LLRGGSGKDTITGGAGSDALFGDGGRDRIVWGDGDGNDLVEGGLGRDRFEVDGSDTEDDVFIAGAADTRVLLDRLGPAAVTLDIGQVEILEINTGGGADSFAATDLVGTDLTALVLDMGEGNDVVDGTGSWVPMMAFGGPGDDVFRSGHGSDRLFGGPGIDMLDCSVAAAGVNVSFREHRSKADGFGSKDRHRGLEDLTGSQFDDRLQGDNGANVIDGGSGDDTLTGRGGSDTLFGGEDDDALLGGSGDDILNGGPGADIIDGGLGQDMLDFTGATGSVVVDPDTGTAQDGTGGSDVFRDVEGALGSDFLEMFPQT